jgi:general secretion pathway protein H
MMKREQGFTLIEILVVLFIMSIVTSVALLSINRNENRQLETFTNELVQRMTLAEEEAMLKPSVLGLSIKNKMVQFTSYQPAESGKKSSWQATEDHLLANHAIPASMEVSIEVGGKKLEIDEEKQFPQVVISTNGDLTPFIIYVGKKGQAPRYVINGDADGNITSKLLT